MHKSGFVNIVGRPNVGKSTLMNALVGMKMSIITSKPQTTRHRIMGIINEEDCQIVFSDTPGFINEPHYKMQEKMNNFVSTTFEDADVMLFVTDMFEKYEADHPVYERLKKVDIPLFLIVNKIDLRPKEDVLLVIKEWTDQIKFKEVFPISALNSLGTEEILKAIKENIKEGPAFYPKDQLTDKSERFFVSEIIREKILQQYKQEVPYSCEVAIDYFKESDSKSGPIIKIGATIFAARKSQKPILIGKDGSAIKKLGTEARKDIEAFLDHRVFLDLSVKVKDGWRDDEQMLKHFGYQQ